MDVSWDQMCSEIKKIFSQDSVDIDHVKKLLKSYSSNRKDWNKYANFEFDADRSYTRNLVDGNEKYDLIVLCWDKGRGSCIHDHSGSDCVMKVLSGKLKETKYEKPKDKESTTPLQIKDESVIYSTDDVTHINDSIGLHKIENPSTDEAAVSLHLYSPSIKCCETFDEHTGTACSSNISFYSKNGIVCKNEKVTFGEYCSGKK